MFTSALIEVDWTYLVAIVFASFLWRAIHPGGDPAHEPNRGGGVVLSIRLVDVQVACWDTGNPRETLRSEQFEWPSWVISAGRCERAVIFLKTAVFLIRKMCKNRKMNCKNRLGINCQWIADQIRNQDSRIKTPQQPKEIVVENASEYG